MIRRPQTFATCALLLASSGAGAQQPRVSARQIKQAQAAYLAGARAVERNNLAEADRQFSRALALNPSNPDYSRALTITHQHELTALTQQAEQAHLAGRQAEADALLAQARRLDPENRIVTQHEAALALADQFRTSPAAEQVTTSGIGGRVQGIRPRFDIAGPIVLHPSNARKAFEIKAETVEVVRQVADAYGIRTVFDAGVPHQVLRFELDAAPYAQTMPILLRMAKLMAVPLDEKTLLIASDTRDNRDKYQRQLEETIYFPALPPEQLTDVGNVVRNVFDVHQATIDPGSGSIVLRAPQDTIAAVNTALSDLFDGGGEVQVEVKLVEIDRNHNQNTGITPPQQFGAYSVQGEAASFVAANQSLVNQGIASGLIPAGASVIQEAILLLASGLATDANLTNTLAFIGRFGTTTINGVTSSVPLLGITTSSYPTLNLGLSVSDTRSLDEVTLRMSDRQPATFRAGTKYPITTATYSSAASQFTPQQIAAAAAATGQSASALTALASNTTTVPQVQYEDLGVTLKCTPTIQKSGNVSLQVDLKIEALAGTSNNGIPILVNRQYVSTISLAKDDTALLVSSVSSQESRAVNGLPGISEIPGFQDITQLNYLKDSSDLVILLTPHIVRRRSSTIAGPRIAVTAQPPSTGVPESSD